MHDAWSFGLLTTSKLLLCVETVTNIHQAADGSLWLDVELLESAPSGADRLGVPVLVSPTSKKTCSVNCANIVAALELADT